MSDGSNNLPGNGSDAQLHTGVIAWFARNPVAANLLMLTVIALGLFAVGQLRKETFPSIEPDRVTVSVAYDSGDAKQNEEGIAMKVEEALETVPGIKRITSTSTANSTNVVIERTTDYDLDLLLTDIKNKVDAIYNFPVDAEKPVIDKARRSDHAIYVQLSGDVDRAVLQSLAERLKVELLAKPAVRDLSILAKARPMMSIEIDEARLQALGLTLADVADAVNAESITNIAGSLRTGDKTIRLKADNQAYHTQDFADLIVKATTDGSLIRLGDVAIIHDGFEDDPQVFSRFNGKPGIAIDIVMDENSDITEVVEQAESVVSSWKASTRLPTGVEITTWHDSSETIKQRLSLMMENAFTGIVLVFLLLAIFLNLRVAFWVAAGLPFIVFGTLFFMTGNFADLTINNLTTFGFIMALGIVVDDAVVIGESIYDTRSRYGDTLENTIRGAQKVAVPTIFGVLTTVVAFGAMANVDGRLGKIFSFFGIVVTICLLLSMVESKLILPAHLAHLNTRKKPADASGKGFWLSRFWANVQHKADAGLNWFNQVVYRQAIARAIHYRYAVLLGFATIFVLVMGMPLTGAVRVSFFPDIPGDIVGAQVTMRSDSSYGQTSNNLLRLEQTAMEADESLMQKHQQTGSSILSLQVTADADKSGRVLIELDQGKPYSSGEFEALWQKLTGQPEGTQALLFYSKFRLSDDFKVELKAWDLESLEAAGAAFKTALEQQAGVSGINDNLDTGQAQLQFRLTPEGRALGMDTASLSRQVLRTFGGAIVQRYQRDKDEIRVRVRYPETDRQTLGDVMQSRIRTPDGMVVPLSSVATIDTAYQQEEITRIDGQRAIYLSAVVDKNQIAANELVNQLQRDLVPQLQRQYPGLAIHFAGEAEEQQETTSSIEHMFLIALLMIYVLLAIPLRSYLQPLVIMSVIPFGIVGAVLGHWINDLPLGVLSLNGILALSGVVVNDSLLLVSRFNDERQEHGLSYTQAIVEACTSRLRAVLLTSVTTFAGLAPLLSETSRQAQFLKPAAASLAYGILFATVITLVLIPVLLVVQRDFGRILQRVKGRISGNDVLALTD
ncbi:Antibiotic efflux pump membrane transporter ArpB [BD1-7 clade bacterium]|uniref:Antibiotic efflux pump membrane transporter ArpB n=1 Tax=BD1-7 clade bacterium TaxID=2029982 RepID=A0A5S9QY62_9GAMM|nr:Antibiotic efflux pump membrane transporter ArpB [BD1-7 clade bacterium]